MNLTELECKILIQALYQWENDATTGTGLNTLEPVEGAPVFESHDEYIALLQKLEPEKDQDGDIINWRDVAESFYHACGGANGGCGNLQSIDNLVKYYAKNIEPKECYECSIKDNLEWLGCDDEEYQWYCPECKELNGYGDDEDDKEDTQ